MKFGYLFLQSRNSRLHVSRLILFSLIIYITNTHCFEKSSKKSSAYTQGAHIGTKDIDGTAKKFYKGVISTRCIHLLLVMYA